MKSIEENISREGCNIVGNLAGQHRCRTEGTRKKGKMIYELQEKNSLKVFYTNCRSILNKINPLRGLVSVENFDIMTITKTWLDITGKAFYSEVTNFSMLTGLVGGEKE